MARLSVSSLDDLNRPMTNFPLQMAEDCRSYTAPTKTTVKADYKLTLSAD
jgi:hypothetical protein